MYPKNYFEAKNFKTRRGTCFVIMPFAEKFDEVYLTFRDTLQSEKVNLICFRGDDIYEPHILESLLRKIIESEYIIVDLTDSNTNVFYELGLVHSVKKMNKVVIVSQDIDFIPFDLKQFRCIIYENSDGGLDKLKLNLEEAFSEASRNSYRMSLKENFTIAFDKKIVGKENNLYNFKIEVPYIGHGLIKLIFSFEEFRIDKAAEKIESQFLFVSEDDRIKHLDIIPWTVSYVETKGNTGRISLDKKY